MTVEAFRIQNFMGFADSGWIELRPITLLFGRNSAGKSAIIRSLLLLRQSLESRDGYGALLFVKDDGHDFGNYREIVRDHNESNQFSFWFKCRFDKNTDHPFSQRAYQALTALAGEAREGSKTRSVFIRLIIGLDSRSQLPYVTSLSLFDEKDDLILRAEIPGVNDSTSQSIWKFVSDFFDLYDKELEVSPWPYVEIFPQQGFLPGIKLMDSLLAQSDDVVPTIEDFGEPFNQIWLILRGIRHAIKDLLKGINYLGPLRATPQRFYYVAGQGIDTPERGQQYVRDLLRSEQSSLEELNQWLEQSCFGVRIRLDPLDKQHTLYELRIEEDATKNAVILSTNIREVGFGLTQLLPIITEAFIAKPETVLVIEQPELHLHPRAQAELGDAFIAIARRGVFCLIETHSEHLLLRLRRRVAEAWSGRVPKDNPHHLVANDLATYFVDRVAGMSYLEPIKIDSLGKMSSPPGFRGFFADDLQELALLNQAILDTYK